MHECVCSFNKCKLVCWFYWSVWSITNCQVGKKAEKHSNLWFPIINNDRSSCYELYNGTSDAFRFWMNSCVCGSDLDIELVNSTFLLQPYFSIALLLSLIYFLLDFFLSLGFHPTWIFCLKFLSWFLLSTSCLSNLCFPGWYSMVFLSCWCFHKLSNPSF